MNANVYATKDYKNETTLRPKKTKPIQTQFKPNSNSVLSAVERANLETSTNSQNSKAQKKLQISTTDYTDADLGAF